MIHFRVFKKKLKTKFFNTQPTGIQHTLQNINQPQDF